MYSNIKIPTSISNPDYRITDYSSLTSELVQLQQAIQRIEEESTEVLKKTNDKSFLGIIKQIKWIVGNEVDTYKLSLKKGKLILPEKSIYLLDHYGNYLFPPFIEEKNSLIDEWYPQINI